MIDIETHERLEVSTEGGAGPCLLVPLDQLPDVRRVLREKGITHSIVESAIGLDGRPVIAMVDFGVRADAARIQTVLDGA